MKVPGYSSMLKNLKVYSVQMKKYYIATLVENLVEKRINDRKLRNIYPK